MYFSKPERKLIRQKLSGQTQYGQYQVIYSPEGIVTDLVVLSKRLPSGRSAVTYYTPAELLRHCRASELSDLGKDLTD